MRRAVGAIHRNAPYLPPIVGRMLEILRSTAKRNKQLDL
jgi:hypothetical protein